MWATLLIALLPLPFPAPLAAQEASHLCADYDTRDAAQAAFDKDPDRLWELDEDRDGLACEHLPVATTSDESDDTSVFPWIAGGLVALGGMAGAVFAFRRRPGTGSGPTPVPSGPNPGYDPAIEFELELIKSEQENGQPDVPDIQKPPTPGIPDAGGSGTP